jgi:arsenite methyltransferase
MTPHDQPEWFWHLLTSEDEGGATSFLRTHPSWTLDWGIPRSSGATGAAQQQTAETFGFKWTKRETFEDFAQTFTGTWLREKYGVFASLDFLKDSAEPPLVVDAGCGAGMSGLVFFESRLNEIRYLGVDVSTAVNVASERFRERGHRVGLLQCDLCEVPIPRGVADVIFSEGVLHHTDDTFKSLASLAQLLKPNGLLMFYVYKSKGPIREFTDDFVRERVQAMSHEEAWNKLMPLTRLGEALGKLDVVVEVPEDVDLLGIPKGAIDVQRLFYWHVVKCFYRPDLTLDEMNHINFDWFVPSNARRHTPEEVRAWCARLGLQIEHECIEEAGITVVARLKRSL